MILSSSSALRPLASFPVLQLHCGLRPLASFPVWAVAAGPLLHCPFLYGRWPASSLSLFHLWPSATFLIDVFPLGPLASFLNASVPFVAAGQLPQHQCSLCGRWPACWPSHSHPLLSFFFFFFFKSLRLLVGVTAKLCIFPPACLSQRACSCRE